MAGKKISQLPSGSLVSLPLSGLTAVVHSGITYQHNLGHLRQILVDSGSHYFTGSQIINGDLTISGSITAQQYILSSSITNITTETISGSSNFGNSLDDKHIFTGSVFVTGSVNVKGLGEFKNLIVGTGSFHNNNPEVLHVENSGSYNIVHFQGYNDYYTQLNVKNTYSSVFSSTDIVATADNGTETNHYVNLGINSSTYGGGFVGYENDAYLINVGKDLYVGTVGGTNHPSKLKLFSQNEWENPQITLHTGSQITFNTNTFTEGYAYEFSGSAKLLNDLKIDGSVVIGGIPITGSDPTRFHLKDSGSINIAHFETNNQHYAQVNILNTNSGNNASSDIVATADNGSETNHYVNLGINSSTYDGGFVGYENDAYLLNVGKDLYVGTVGGTSHPAKLKLFAQNQWIDPQMTIHTGSQITFNTNTFTEGYTYEFSGSVKLQNNLQVDGGITGSVDWSNIINAPSVGSGSSYEEVLYSELYSNLTGSTLTPGKYYLITDFKTCYDQPDYDSTGTPITTGNYKEGSVAPILVLATATDKISEHAYQPQYSGDTIQYDPYFTLTEVTSGEAFGRITYRVDEKGNAFDYDFREVRFKRYNTHSADEIYTGKVDIDGLGVMTGTGTNFTNHAPGNVIGVVNWNTAYGINFYEIVTIDSDTSMIVTGHTINPVVNTFYTNSTSESGMSYKKSNIISNTGFTEYYTFTGYDSCFNNTCGNRVAQTLDDGQTFLLSNNVFRSSPYIDNSFGSNFRNNTFNDDCINNTISGDFYNNVIDNDFDYNTISATFNNNMIICDFQSNIIQNSFYNNHLGDNDGMDFRENLIMGQFYQNIYTGYDNFADNIIKDSFYNNVIFRSFENNTTNGFGDNIIENDFNENTVGTSFNTNLIKNSFRQNVIGDTVYLNNFYSSFERNTIGSNSYSNNFYSLILNNKLGSGFYQNTIGDSSNIGGWGFTNNSFGNECYNNTYSGDTHFNTVGHYFNYNNLGNNFSNNQIGSFFNNNTIASDFGFGGSMERGNIIGNRFYNNTVGEYFYDNTFGDNCFNNVFPDYFTNNRVSYNMYNTTFLDVDNATPIRNNTFTFGEFSMDLTLSGGLGGNPILYSNTSVNVVNDAANGGTYVTYLSGGTITVQSIII